MKKIIILIFILSMLIISGCVKLSPEELESRIDYCSDFKTEDTCDKNMCNWDYPVKCAIPGKNCGSGFMPFKVCKYKDHFKFPPVNKTLQEKLNNLSASQNMN